MFYAPRTCHGPYHDKGVYRSGCRGSRVVKLLHDGGRTGLLGLYGSVVEDQIPVATNDDAKVTLLESSNAKVDEKEGRLKWTLHLAPGEKKELNINYEVKVKDEFLFDKLMSDQEL